MTATDRLKTWNCPECGAPSFWWYFDGPDGTILTAELPAVPDMSALATAKEKALADHERQRALGTP